MKKVRIAVSTLLPEKISAAKSLANSLYAPYIDNLSKNRLEDHEYLLLFTETHLELREIQGTKKNFYIDFFSKQNLYRIKKVTQKEFIVKAMGIKPKDNPFIVDATAGLGRDSFILSAYGFKITLLERSRIIFVLLKDALERCQNDPILHEIVQRLTLIYTDAITWLKALPENLFPDVIYLDPMFPIRRKSASVKKEMSFLQNFLGTDSDTNELFHLALTCAKKRVVVKRPRLVKPLISPSFSLHGQSSRFDIYLV